MITLKRHLPRTLLLTALLGAAPLALAGPEHPGHGGDPWAGATRHLAHAVKRLDLTTEQEDAIKAIFEANREDLKTSFVAERELREELHEILTADVLDENALADAAQRSGELTEERVLLSGTVTAAVLAELDETQKAELQAMREERQDRRRERFSRRYGSD